MSGKSSFRVKEWVNKEGLNWKLHRLDSRVKTVKEAADALGVDESIIVKTLVIKCGGSYYAFILQGNTKLDLWKISEKLDCKPRLAKPWEVREATGYNVGGVPPAPLPENVRLVIDVRVARLERVFAGGGDEYTLLEFNPKELIEKINPMVLDVSS
jgi:prolyl-tRNA editing enzyme YbaK/EbsC (Cys-tRNA(Pro) deacylase)